MPVCRCRLTSWLRTTCWHPHFPCCTGTTSRFIRSIRAPLAGCCTISPLPRPRPHAATRERVPFIEVPAVEGCQPPAVLEIFKKVYLPVHETIHLARGVICNAVDGMEEEFVKRVKKHPDMAGVALYTVGPLFQDDGPRLNAEKHDATTQGSYGFRTHFLNSTVNADERSGKCSDFFPVLEWLNKKEPFSVVYVSFSTVVKLQPQQIDVISKALTAFGQPFIWSLPDAEQAFLPANLSAGIKHQWADEAASFLILNWAPQKLILDHTATSVALSHCGFNSTMECLTAGVPVAAWPQATDQKMDALLLEHCGTGLLIKGTGDRATGETVTAAAVEEALRRVSCLPFQAAADEWKNKMKEVTCPTGSSQRDLTTLVKDLSLWQGNVAELVFYYWGASFIRLECMRHIHISPWFTDHGGMAYMSLFGNDYSMVSSMKQQLFPVPLSSVVAFLSVISPWMEK